MRTELKILIAASFIYNFGAGLFGPLYAIFVEEIGGNILTAGSAWAAYSIAVGVAMFIFSRYEDYLPKEKLIVIGYGLLSFGFIGYYLISTQLHLFIVQMYMGFSLALIDPVWNAYFGKKVDKKKEAAEWGDWEAGSYILIGLAALAGGIIAFKFGFKTLFLIAFAICAVSTVVSYLLIRKSKK